MSFKLELERDTVSQAPLVTPLTVAPETTLIAVCALLRAERRGSVLVCRDGRLVGILTERDLVRLMADGLAADRVVGDAMTASPTTVGPGTTMAEAIRKMAESGYRRLPVIDGNGKPVGVLKVTGVVDYLVDYVPATVFNLPSRPNATTAHREGP